MRTVSGWFERWDKTGDRVELLINDQVRNYTVRGVYPDSNGNESAIVTDLAVAHMHSTLWPRRSHSLESA